jgi:membrane protein required for colicin V production
MADLSLTAFDVGVLVVIVLSALLALVRGLVRETLSLLAWIGAGAIAWFGFPSVQDLAGKTIETDWIAGTVSFFVVFVLPLIALKLVAATLGERVPGGAFARVDRTAGVVFGIARGALLVCIGYLGLTMLIAPANQPPWIKEAAVLPYVRDGADWLRGLIPENLGSAAEVAGP